MRGHEQRGRDSSGERRRHSSCRFAVEQRVFNTVPLEGLRIVCQHCCFLIVQCDL